MNKFSPEHLYEELAGHKLSLHQIERFMKIQRVLKIHDEDAVWVLCIIYEEFYYRVFNDLGTVVGRWLKFIAFLQVVIIVVLVSNRF